MHAFLVCLLIIITPLQRTPGIAARTPHMQRKTHLSYSRAQDGTAAKQSKAKQSSAICAARCRVAALRGPYHTTLTHVHTPMGVKTLLKCVAPDTTKRRATSEQRSEHSGGPADRP